MSAEEYVVQKVMELEKDLQIAKAALEGCKKKFNEYESLLDALKRRIKVTRFGVDFEFKNYEEEQSIEIQSILSKFFEVKPTEE